MDFPAIESTIQEYIKRAILPFDNLKDSVLLGVFVRAAMINLKELIARIGQLS